MLPKLNNLTKIVKNFKNIRILVIGDIMLDRYLYGHVTRISPEAPVPIVNIDDEKFFLGGAGNILSNIVSLGGEADICGIIGLGDYSDKLLNIVNLKTTSSYGIIESDKKTSVKTRIVAQCQQIMRYDDEEISELTPNQIGYCTNFFDESIHNYDAVIVADYSKGVINEHVMDSLYVSINKLETATGRGIPIIVDPKTADLDIFEYCTIIKPNHHEAAKYSGNCVHNNFDWLSRAASNIKARVKSDAVLITKGADGMYLLTDDESNDIKSFAKEVFDVTGAGDTVSAVLALSIASMSTFYESAVLSNIAAGIVVGKRGTATLSMPELLEGIIESGYS